MDPTTRCPDCGTPFHPPAPACRRCGLPLQGAEAAELHHVEHQIAALDQQRAALLARHETLLDWLRAERERRRAPAPVPAPSPARAAPHHPDGPWRPAGTAYGAGQDRPGTAPTGPPPPGPAARPPRPRRELSALSVRNVLLALGGLLIATAAVVFTLFAWSDLGLGGRAAILGGATALLAYLPRPLYRNDMTATAETVGALAIVLLCLDGFALWTIAFSGLVDGLAYAALAVSVIAALLAAYPRLVPLRGPRLVALLLAQSVPLLVALAMDASAGGTGLALLVTALGDLLLLTRGRVRARHLRATATGLGTAAWGLSVLVVVATTIRVALLDGDGEWTGAGILALAGATALLAARHWDPSPAAHAALGAATVTWTAVLPATTIWLAPPEWGWPAWTLSAVAAATVLPWLDRRWLPGPLVAVPATLAVVSLAGLPALASLGGQLGWVLRPWQGPPPDGTAAGVALLPPALTAVAAAAGWALWAWRPYRPLAAPLALGAGTLAAVLGAQWLPHPATVTVLACAAMALLVAATALGQDTREAPGTARDPLAGTALALALAVGALAVSGALATGTSTALVLSALLITAAGCGFVPAAATPARAAAAAVAVLAASGLSLTATLLVEAPPTGRVLVLVATAGTAVALATALERARIRIGQVRVLDLSAAVPALLALGLALPGGRDLLALALGLVSVLALVAATHGVWPSRAAPAGSGRRRGSAGLPGLVLTCLAPLPVLDQILVTALSPAWVAARAWPWRWPEESTALPLLFPSPGLPLFLPAVGVTAVAWALHAGLRWGRAGAATAGLVSGGALVPIALTHLGVPYDLALTALTVATLVPLVLSGRVRGPAAHTLLWTALALGLMATGWAATTPARSVAVLGALGLGAAVAAVVTSRAARASAPAVPGILAFAAATGIGTTLLAGYAALPRIGVPADPRWHPFVGLAAAGAAAALAAALGRVDTSPPGEGRTARRTGLSLAALLLVALGASVGLDLPDYLGLVAAVAALVLAALVTTLTGRARWLPATLTAVAVLAAAASVLVEWATALFAPYAWLGAGWRGAGGLMVPAPSALSPAGGPVPFDPVLLPVTTLAALGIIALVWVWPRPAAAAPISGRAPVERARLAMIALATPVLAPFPTVLELPYALALGWLLFLTALLAAAAVAAASRAVTTLAGAMALWPASTALAWGLAEPPATLATLLLVALVGAAYPVLGRDVAVTAGATATATLATGGFAIAVLLALGQPSEVAALGPIAVVAGVAGALGAARLPRVVSLAAEGAAAALAVAAIGLTLAGPGRLELTSVALASLGVIALASAPRKGRRWLGGAGAVLLLAALWVLLGWLGVAAPEPYLAVPALAALVLGWEWRRRVRAAARSGAEGRDGGAPEHRLPSSWLAFGPGLALALLPSLATIYWTDDGALRPALLGTAALGVTLLGGWHRIQAPLLLGGAVLLLVAQQAFGAPLWDLVVRMPRWIPVGVTGLLLLVIGARYERNLRDLRRFAGVLRRME